MASYKAVSFRGSEFSHFLEMCDRITKEEVDFEQGLAMSDEGRRTNNRELFWSGVTILTHSKMPQNNSLPDNLKSIASICLQEFRDETAMEHTPAALELLFCLSLHNPLAAQWLYTEHILELVSDRLLFLDPVCVQLCAKILACIALHGDETALHSFLEQFSMERIVELYESTHISAFVFIIYMIWSKCHDVLASLAPQMVDFVAQSLVDIPADVESLGTLFYFLRIELQLCVWHSRITLTRLCTRPDVFLKLVSLFSGLNHVGDVCITIIDIWKILMSKVKGERRTTLLLQLPLSVIAMNLTSDSEDGIVSHIFELLSVIAGTSDGVAYIIRSRTVDFVCEGCSGYSFKDQVSACDFLVLLFRNATVREMHQLFKMLKSILTPLINLFSCEDESLQRKLIDAIGNIFDAAQKMGYLDEARSVFLELQGLEAIHNTSPNVQPIAERLAQVFQLESQEGDCEMTPCA